MADISFNTACKELKIAQIDQLNQLFQPLHLPYLPVYKSTFYSLKICLKNLPRLIHVGQKPRSKKVQDKLA